MSETPVKLAESLVGVVNEKAEDFDDYSYINHLHTSINKSNKLNTKFKSRTKTKEYDSKFSLQGKENQ